MWCATSGAGLLKIQLDDQAGPVFSQLDAEQGLPSQNVFAVQPQANADGRESLLIGTSRGVARYRPDRVAPTLYATRVISKRVHSAGELQSGLYLEYPQNSLLFDVAATQPHFPEQFSRLPHLVARRRAHQQNCRGLAIEMKDCARQVSRDCARLQQRPGRSIRCRLMSMLKLVSLDLKP